VLLGAAPLLRFTPRRTGSLLAAPAAPAQERRDVEVVGPEAAFLLQFREHRLVR